MKLHTFIGAAALALASLTAHAADATQSYQFPLTGSASGYTASPTVLHSEAGSFEDTFHFSYTGSALVDVSLVTVGMGDEQRITFSQAWLNGVPLAILPVDEDQGTFVGQAHLFNRPMTGDFTLVVRGYAGGPLPAGTGISASYAGTFNVMPTSVVPEPHGAAMLVAGLGTIGLLFMRRRKR